MTKKTFLWEFKEQNFNNQKAITKEFFKKSFVRKSLKVNKQIKIIDDSSTISDFYFHRKKKRSLKKKLNKFKLKGKKELKFKQNKKISKAKKAKKVFKKRKSIKTGTALHLKEHTLRHKFWDKIQIKVPLISTPKNNLFQLRNSINDLVLTKHTNKQKNLPIKILKPKKGGFNVRYSIIKGFLSNKQYRNAKMVFEMNNFKESSNSLLSNKYLTKLVKTNKYISFRKVIRLNKGSKIAETKFWKIKKHNFFLPLKIKKLYYKVPNLKKRYVKKHRLGTRRKFFFRRKRYIRFNYKFRFRKKIQFSKKSQIKKIIFKCQKPKKLNYLKAKENFLGKQIFKQWLKKLNLRKAKKVKLQKEKIATNKKIKKYINKKTQKIYPNKKKNFSAETLLKQKTTNPKLLEVKIDNKTKLKAKKNAHLVKKKINMEKPNIVENMFNKNETKKNSFKNIMVNNLENKKLIKGEKNISKKNQNKK